MSEPHVITALIAKRGELAGLIDYHMQEIKRLDSELHHLDATIKLFAPEYDLRTVKAKKHRKKNAHFKTGECARLVLDVLREHGETMSTDSIAMAILKKKGLDENDKDVVAFVKKAAITALRHQDKRQLVKNVGKNGANLLWKLR